MTNLEKFTRQRGRLVEALNAAGIKYVLFNAFTIPKGLPCAVVELGAEEGQLPTGRQFLEAKLDWTLYLVVNAEGVADPDSVLYTLKEAFRDEHLKNHGKDFSHVEFYVSRIDGSREVRIAKITGVKA
jgi:hypothetical protein